jgi:26S proteasome regulatory subunit N2
LLSFQKDVKPEVKKDVDVEMKVDEPLSPKHGDISPISASISNFAEDGKLSASKLPRKAEPTSESLPNFSRVTPAQLAHITFPPDGRYQPVRAVTTKSIPPKNTKSQPSLTASTSAALGLPSERYAGGGGILILADMRPEAEAEFIELTAHAPVQPAQTPLQNGHAVAGPPASGPHIALDESAPEANPPDTFEVRSYIFKAIAVANPGKTSTHLIMTHDGCRWTQMRTLALGRWPSSPFHSIVTGSRRHWTPI